MSDVANNERRRIAGEFLTRARDDLERAIRTRNNYINTARNYGMTDTDIATILGIQEADLATHRQVNA